MSPQPSPHEILQTLLPHLRVAAGYAQQIQTKITSLPAKDGGDNILSAALTDADLSIQTLVEVALLGTYPEMAFYGEEYEQSRNTKYFSATELGKNDYLVTLDPIDGTKYYLDGFDNYQIISSMHPISKSLGDILPNLIYARQSSAERAGWNIQILENAKESKERIPQIQETFSLRNTKSLVGARSTTKKHITFTDKNGRKS